MYFLSPVNFDKEVLEPRVPSNYFTDEGYEDNTTPRVCFAPTIKQCLLAIATEEAAQYEFYIHVPVGSPTVVVPTTKEVPDSHWTNEIWVTEPVQMKTIGVLGISGISKDPKYEFTYGDNETASLYEWYWELIK